MRKGEGKDLLGRPKRRRKNNKIYFKDTGRVARSAFIKCHH